MAGAKTMLKLLLGTSLCVACSLSTALKAADMDTSRVNAALLPAVVKVTSLSSTGSRVSLGTGFIVSRTPADGRPGREYYLITNKHVVGDWTVFDGKIGTYFSAIEVSFYG